MSDLTRGEAINWCREKMADFRDPVFPPPSGWAWAQSGAQLVLTPIFTITDQGDEITAIDVGMLPAART